MLRNLERDLPAHIELSPRVESMRQRKVKHIVFVDDFLGTGSRFIKAWRSVVPRSVKSWAALGWCKVWILSFAAHESGLRRIERELKAVERTRVRTRISIEKSFIAASGGLVQLCNTGGRPNARPRMPLGYGNLCSPIVFQYGCPNNAPGILWSRDNPRGAVKPLFPNRSVPADLFGLFGKDHSSASTAEDLWLSGHCRLALRYLDEPEAFASNRVELAMLAYLAGGRKPADLKTIMVLSDSEFDSKMQWLVDLGFLAADFSITRFGLDVLKRGGRKCSPKRVASCEYRNYYPSSFLGFQRDV